MKTTIRKLVIAGFITIAPLASLGCSETADTNEAYVPPANSTVVDVPTTVATVPASGNSTTVTTQFDNGAVERRTTTNYNPPYVTAGPPYRTTVVPSSSIGTAPATSTTRTTTTSDDDGVVQKQTTTTVTPSGY